MPDLIREVRAPVVVPRYLLHGLSLPGKVLRALTKRGIYCQPGVSLEHQNRAGRYVLRGVESGGAVSDMGRACIFVSPGGMPLPWLQKIDSFAVNGRHAIFLAESLVRIDMLRVGRTCDTVITAHTLSHNPGRHRPEIKSTLLFRGRDGVLPAELWRPEHRAMCGEVAPRLPQPRRRGDRSAGRISRCNETGDRVCVLHRMQTFARGSPSCRGWCRIDTMPFTKPFPITIGEPNWAPLETALTPRECENFMYMGRFRTDRVVQACLHAPLPQHQPRWPAILPARA